MQVFSPSVLTAITRFATQNGAGGTVPGVMTNIITLGIGLCIPGQLVFVTSRMQFVKGITTGDSLHNVNRSAGPGDILFLDGLAAIETKLIQHPNGLQWISVLSAIGLVTVGGDVTLATRAQSLGSDGTFGIGDANMVVLRINR